MTIDEF